MKNRKIPVIDWSLIESFGCSLDKKKIFVENNSLWQHRMLDLHDWSILGILKDLCCIYYITRWTLTHLLLNVCKQKERKWEVVVILGGPLNTYKWIKRIGYSFMSLKESYWLNAISVIARWPIFITVCHF